ncbi:hypothetical protein TNCV_4154381 [Trichonephila clavipes]|nr:hypothetical protein TNCV_4154381 [Trichonephila clavipes]
MMLNDKNKAYLVQFFMNKESANAILRKFRKKCEAWKRAFSLSTVVHLVKLVQRFEENGSLEDRVRSGRLSLRIIIKRCKFAYPPRAPDQTPVDFWQLGDSSSRVY